MRNSFFNVPYVTVCQPFVNVNESHSPWLKMLILNPVGHAQ